MTCTTPHCQKPAVVSANGTRLCRRHARKAILAADPPHAPKPTYWNRWRAYGWSCLGHTAQGLIAGYLVTTGMVGAMAALIWTLLYIAYQGLSFARKANNDGRGDSAGLDTADFLVGFLIALAAITAYTVLRNIGSSAIVVGGGPVV